MRLNLPVTQNEYPVRDDVVIVSHTDLKGRITYANDDFCEYAGMTREELLGQPHNVIRHPDMPPEAFRDLWATIKAGHVWQGIVKNRRKNGDHYWVKATTKRPGDARDRHDGHDQDRRHDRQGLKMAHHSEEAARLLERTAQEIAAMLQQFRT